MPQTRSVSFTSPYDAELAEIDRRRALAQALSQQAAQPLPTNRMAGRVAIPISPLEGAAQLVKGASGAYGQRQADEQQRSVAQRRSEALAQALRGMPQAQMQAQPSDQEGTGAFDMMGNASPAQQMVRPGMAQNSAWLGKLAGIGPDAVSMGGTMLGMQQRSEEAEANRQARTQDRMMQLEAAAQNAALGREAQARAAQDAAALRRELQGSQQAFAAQQAEAQRQFAAQQAQLGRENKQEQIIQTADGPMRLVNGVAMPITTPAGQSIKAPSGKAGPMSATAQRELIETEEQLQGGQQALSFLQQAKTVNDKAMGFTGAGAVASAGSLLPEALRPETVDATMELTNVIQNVALPQLKSIFGGMPTEGERKILLEMQGSASQPPAVRRGIFDRAEKAVQARMKFSQEKAKRLRDGTYFSGEGLPSIGGAGGGGGLSAAEQKELDELRKRFGR